VAWAAVVGAEQGGALQGVEQQGVVALQLARCPVGIDHQVDKGIVDRLKAAELEHGRAVGAFCTCTRTELAVPVNSMPWARNAAGDAIAACRLSASAALS
jgi:hypothetical protein